MTTVESSEAVRCATWARSVGLDPGGTAGTPNGFAVVDWALPWPRDIGDIPELAGVADVARRHGLRLQGRVPTLGRPRTVTLYRRPGPGPFTRYDQQQIEIGAAAGDDLAAAVAGVVGRPATDPDPRPGNDAPVDQVTDGQVSDDQVEVEPARPGEVLVCTHGRRDTCCGSAGTVLFAELTGSGPPVAGASVADRPLHRTSHTGGHRFAPTVIVLPEGTAWAFADADLIRRVVTRSGPLDDIVPRYRGCTGLTSPAIQCLERAVLPVLGWPLLGSARQGEELGGGQVRLSVLGPGGDTSVWEAEVVTGRTVAVPDCGRPLDEARKTETERVVRGLHRVL